MPRRIECGDALPWLRAHADCGAVVTSLPDADEIGASMGDWAAWFREAAAACARGASPGAPAIFYQTDRKAGGGLHSKALLVMEAASAAGSRLLWHKIVLARAPGLVDIRRPGYSHLIAVSRSGKPGKASPDVIGNPGQRAYANGLGLNVAIFACRFAALSARRIVDPFCGRGTIPATAEALGLEAIGIDIDPAQCDHARRLKVEITDGRGIES